MFRSAILDAAEEAFADAGFHGAHVQAIAKRAGLSVGSIYNHFGQKEDVLIALVEDRLDALLEALRPAAGDPKSFADKLAARLERVLAYRERHAAFFAVAADLGIVGETTTSAQQLFGGRSLPQLSALRRMWLDLVGEGLAAKALAPLDRELLAAHLKGTLRTIARWSRETRAPARTPAEIAQLTVDMFLRGVGRTAKKR